MKKQYKKNIKKQYKNAPDIKCFCLFIAVRTKELFQMHNSFHSNEYFTKHFPVFMNFNRICPFTNTY